MDGVTGNAPIFSDFSSVSLQVLVSAVFKRCIPPPAGDETLDGQSQRGAKGKRSYSFTK